MSTIKYILSAAALFFGVLILGWYFSLASAWSGGNSTFILLFLIVGSPLIALGAFLAGAGAKGVSLGEGRSAPRQPRLSPNELATHLDRVTEKHIRDLERTAERKAQQPPA